MERVAPPPPTPPPDEHECDPEQRFRPVTGPARFLAFWALVGLAVYQYYGAGFGTPAMHWHVGIFMGVVIGAIFLVFPATARGHAAPPEGRWWKPGNVPLYDWVLGFAALVSALYLPVTLESLTLRIGSPNTTDIVVGTAMIATIFEATRRTMGAVLPIIVLAFLLYGMLGPYVPVQVLEHPGTNWPGFVSHVYMTTEGIYGIPIQVISTFVLHFVLFGTIATRMCLGRFFIDVSQCLAGRYAGGPAKVSVVSSALFGTVNGSSIANTVTTGALTIPAMKWIGYPGHFAGAVEAAASTGG